MKQTAIFALSSALLLTACASTGDSTNPVITRADATHETTGLGSTKIKAQEAALATAKKQCGSKTAVIINDKHTYNGILDEKTGRMVEQGVSIAGAIFGAGVPNLSRGDDHEYHITFQCK